LTKKKKMNLTEHTFSIDRSRRNALNKHHSFVIWFTGLSGSGKSTLANLLEVELYNKGIRTFLLDGDNMRLGLNKDLTFSDSDRVENIRRIAEVSKLMVDAGLVTIAAFVSPFKKDRENLKAIMGKENSVEIFVDTPIEECIKRDPKGLYKKALSGEIKNFTGISSPYEKPDHADITVNTLEMNAEESVEKILSFLQNKLNWNE
jgi:adenylylsulfate kinase